MTMVKNGTEIKAGDVLVGYKGGRSYVEEVNDSNTMPGMLVVETEHGFLYLDPDEDFEVAN